MTARDPYVLPPGQCIDWWQVIQDLSMHRMNLQAICDTTGIPVSTLNGYKNLGVEPKHADGSRVLSLWHARMAGEPPVAMCSIRQTDRTRK
jgi:hypothetical protein